MPIILDHQLREHIPHNAREFPITYYHDELVMLPDRTGPLHWHPEFEIATAEFGVLDYQVGQHHIILYWKQETVYLSTAIYCTE